MQRDSRGVSTGSRYRTLWAKATDYLQRALYLLGVASFALPFVAVKGCVSTKVHEYAGYELLVKSSGWLYLLPIGLGGLLFGLSFLRQRGDVIVHGFVSAMKAVLSSAAGYVVTIIPEMQFIPDPVYSRVGQFLAAAFWTLVFLASLAGTLTSIKRTWPPQRGTSAGPKGGLLQAVFWFLVILTLGLFAMSIGLSVIEVTSRFFLIIVAAFSLALYLALYFVDLGLHRQERLAAVWVIVTTFSLLGTGAFVLLARKWPGIFSEGLLAVGPIVATVVGVAGLAVAYFPILLRRKSVDS